MDFWDVLAFLFVAGIVMLVIAGIFSKGSETSSVPQRAQKVERRCPYCGHDASIWYLPGQDRYPALFGCGECYRKFGDASRMTEQEKKTMSDSEADCRRAEQMPELARVLRTVYDCTRNSGFVNLKNDTITYFNSCTCQSVAKGSYHGPVSSVGVQHLAVLCIEYCQQQYRGQGLSGITFELMDNGLSWEWQI